LILNRRLAADSKTLKIHVRSQILSCNQLQLPARFLLGPAASPLEAALRNVKGRNRRQMIRDYHSRGFLPALSEDLLRDTLDEDTRRSLDRIHPSFMGGEYLPDYRADEVEIARITAELAGEG